MSVLEPLKILFVCGRNQKRSPTAEKIFRNDPRMEVRSAGMGESSRRRVRESDLLWADLILTMERKHTARIRSHYAHLESLPPMVCLEIPDDYEFMDPELVDLLQDSVQTVLSHFPR